MEESRTSRVPPASGSVDGERGFVNGWVGFEDTVDGRGEGTANYRKIRLEGHGWIGVPTMRNDEMDVGKVVNRLAQGEIHHVTSGLHTIIFC